MADMKGFNVMSVELAIQRELAYRRKIAMLHSSDSNFCRDLRPMELQSSSSGPSLIPSPMSNPGSSPRLSGLKQQAVENSLEILPAAKTHKPVNLTDHFFCKVCQVSCSSYFNYKQHIKGRRHRSNAQELKFGQKDHDMSCGVANQRHLCDLCNIWCMNEGAFQEHLEGQKHKNVLAKGKLAKKNGGEIVIQENWCELCNIGCPDEHSLRMHFNGKKHKAELQKLESAGRGGIEVTDQQYWCELCNIWCIGKESFNMHRKGKRHILQLHDGR